MGMIFGQPPATTNRCRYVNTWGQQLESKKTDTAGECCDACMEQRRRQGQPGADLEVPSCNVWSWCGDKAA